MPDTAETETIRKNMKLIDNRIKSLSDELLCYSIDAISLELDRRSDKHIKYHVERLQRINQCRY